MVRYVNLVGNAVARQAPRDVAYHFAILDSDAVTAASVPGGDGRHPRRFANMTNEADGGCYRARDRARGRPPPGEGSSVQETSQFAKTERLRHPAGEDSSFAARSYPRPTLRYSRDKELEADRNGLQYSAKAGYDAAGLRDFLEGFSRRRLRSRKTSAPWACGARRTHRCRSEWPLSIPSSPRFPRAARRSMTASPSR